MAAASTPQENRQLVADQLVAAIDENRRSIGQARTVLLAPVSGKPPDTAALWKHGAADRSAAAACGVAETAWQAEKSINKDVRDGAVSRQSHGNEAISGFPVPGRGLGWLLRGPPESFGMERIKKRS